LEPKGEPESEPKNEPKVEPESEPKFEPESEPKVEPESEPKVEPESEPKVEPESEPKGVPESESTGEPKSEPKGEPESEPKGEPESEPKVEPESGPQVEPDSKPTAEPESEPKIGPETQAGDVANTQMGASKIVAEISTHDLGSTVPQIMMVSEELLEPDLSAESALETEYVTLAADTESSSSEPEPEMQQNTDGSMNIENNFKPFRVVEVVPVLNPSASEFILPENKVKLQQESNEINGDLLQPVTNFKLPREPHENPEPLAEPEVESNIVFN